MRIATAACCRLVVTHVPVRGRGAVRATRSRPGGLGGDVGRQRVTGLDPTDGGGGGRTVPAERGTAEPGAAGARVDRDRSSMRRSGASWKPSAISWRCCWNVTGCCARRSRSSLGWTSSPTVDGAVDPVARQATGMAVAHHRIAQGPLRGSAGQRQDLVAGRQDGLGLRDHDVSFTQDAHHRGVGAAAATRRSALPTDGEPSGKRHLHDRHASTFQADQTHQVAHGDGLLDHGGQDVRRRHGGVHAPLLGEQPLVLRVVHARQHPGHGELLLGQQ